MRFFLVLFAALTFAAPAAWAMSCDKEDYTEQQSRKNIDAADYIFAGKVIDASSPPELGENLPERMFESYPPPGNPYFAKITYRIDKLYRGENDTKTITIYDGWIGAAIKEEGSQAKEFLKKYPSLVNNGERKIFYAYNFGKVLPLNITNEPFYNIPLICFHVDEKHENQIKEGIYKFSENAETESMFEPDEPRESKKFNNIEALKQSAQKNHPKAEIKNIDFKGEKIISVYEYDPGPIENYGDEDIQQYYLALYHAQKDGSYKRIGEYDAIIKTAGASVSVEGDILRMTADDVGKKQYVDYAVSDLLGQSCLEDEHCLSGHYCLKNDYFKPRGLCSPCAEADPGNRPATCR
ncbi:MAG: hypothetical protein KJ017_09065 [Alphaproteobacteria bacterium]|nr:hypothetical protein [Alphaproteobacteria bacterium]